MKARRHLYHTEGLTDVGRMRECAQAAGKREPTVLHLHPYVEALDGCDIPLTLVPHSTNHELYEPEAAR